ncbi:hypothetical protein scyTo_0004403 [Scyliorhinus torazame]|uniref:Uncharacterized protein n=1 Tax=Scyliorhinus torazame TaxID=75743 RepID=A0A401NRC1_SCYTO|nr:hypothetical protein [Scyliorhinus torazame]
MGGNESLTFHDHLSPAPPPIPHLPCPPLNAGTSLQAAATASGPNLPFRVTENPPAGGRSWGTTSGTEVWAFVFTQSELKRRRRWKESGWRCFAGM